SGLNLLVCECHAGTCRLAADPGSHDQGRTHHHASCRYTRPHGSASGGLEVPDLIPGALREPARFRVEHRDLIPRVFAEPEAIPGVRPAAARLRKDSGQLAPKSGHMESSGSVSLSARAARPN